MDNSRTQNAVRKRAPNACTRCRQQKIRCRGGFPCEQCTKRRLNCVLDDKFQKVLVTRGYISDLERRVASYEKNGGRSHYSLASAVTPEDDDKAPESDEDNELIEAAGDTSHQGNDQPAAPLQPQTVSGSLPTSPGPQLMNPLALGHSAYIPDASGSPVYLGTSSNWSFGRRVLAMSHERALGSPLLSDNLLFQGKVYDLGWDGQRSGSSSPDLDPATLPTPDYAIYLINAVKFHCGQMFHLFDEESFMQRFTQFHDASADRSALSPLWYIHYLLILAFGKAFLARTSTGRRPPGAELFVQAMKLLPDITFLCTDPVESAEILCCAALYLQSLDFRSSAYHLIGQALRITLEHGMHTDMQSQHVQAPLVERCRKIWWTVHVLDRQMSSLMGLPSAIRDEDISAGLPSYPNSTQKAMGLDIQVKLSRVIAQILNTVYGVEGRLDMRYLSSTKAALKNIANVTNQLNHSFNLFVNGSMAGVSRLSAYLHLLHHQCIILATRPLLYTFLEARLNSREIGQRQYGSVQALLQMCIDSAIQSLRVLTGLQEQGLLESFLSFDLDATSTSAIVLLMAAAINPSLVGSDTTLSQRAYVILDEMMSRGNLVAGFVRSELQQLEETLGQVSSIPQHKESTTDPRRSSRSNVHALADDQVETSDVLATSQICGIQPSNSDPTMDESDWQYTVTTEQLMMIADSLDSDGIDWLSFYTPNAAE